MVAVLGSLTGCKRGDIPTSMKELSGGEVRVFYVNSVTKVSYENPESSKIASIDKMMWTEGVLVSFDSAGILLKEKRGAKEDPVNTWINLSSIASISEIDE